MNKTTLLLSITLLATLVSLDAVATRPDALAPTSNTAEALAQPLHTVTIATNDLSLSKLLYVDGLGMQLNGPLPVSSQQRIALNQLWQMPPQVDWQLYSLNRPGVDTGAIRLLVLAQTTAASHNSWDPIELGPLSLGFPTTRQTELDRHIRKLGFGARNQQEIYRLPALDGGEYTIYETVFNGPDFVHAVLIQRGDDMSQIGPVDDSGVGGPAYSALILNDGGQTRQFLVNVLGMEVRSQRQWTSSGDGALGLPKGVEYDFSIVYAKGATSGHLLLLDLRNHSGVATGRPPRLPNRGIAMWSFPVTDLDQVLANARQSNTPVVAGPVTIDSPDLGPVRAATLLAPNGLMIEVFSAVGP